MQALPNLILIGPMGAGKSTIGRLLAAELSRDFYDSDHEIQARCGADIPWIFDVEGEAGFRDRETQMIDELTRLRERGTVIYLFTTVEQQLKRTAKDRNRPLLQRPDKEAVLREMFGVRDPLYRATADITVRTDRRGPRAVVNDIVRRVTRLVDPLKCKA